MTQERGKTLPHLAEDPAARRRFETEARAAARLSHPNIVTIFDTGEDAGVPFIVMERLPGRTLADEIRQGPLPVDRALSVADAVLSALAVAHDAGIVHRDVKPGNVLLTGEGTPKVADFGIAKVTEYSGGATATMTGELLATPAYMGPERLRGAPSTPAGDLYSVGVLLYEMLAGTRPFRGDTPAAVLDAVARGAYEPLRARRPDVPEQVARIVDRALARDPALRFASAQEMARAVVGARDDSGDDVTVADLPLPMPVPMPPQQSLPRTETLPPRRNRVAVRRWVAVVAAAAVVAAVVVGLLAAGGGDPAPTTPGGEPAATVTAGDSGLPPADLFLPRPLDEAIERLEEAVSR